MSSSLNSPARFSSQSIEWGAKLIMMFGGLSTGLALGGISAVLPQIEAELSRGPQDSFLIKQLVGIVGLSMVIGAPLAGFLIDRVGTRRIVMISCLLYALAGTAGLYLPNLPALLASRLLVGILAAAIATTSMTLINTRLEGVDRAKWMGIHVGVAMIGAIMMQPIAGYLGEFGWRFPFALYGLIGLLLAVAALGIRAGVQQRSRVVTTGPSPLTWFPFRFAALALVIGSITYMPTVYVPFLLREQGVTSPTLIGLVLMGESILGAVLALSYGKARRHLSSSVAFVFSFACTATGLAIAALAPTFVSVLIGLTVFGLGIGWFVPNLMSALAQQVSLEHQGRAVGLVKAAHYLAAPLGVVVAEPLSNRVGPAGALMAAAALAFALLLVMSYRIIVERQRIRQSAAVAGGM